MTYLVLCTTIVQGFSTDIPVDSVFHSAKLLMGKQEYRNAKLLLLNAASQLNNSGEKDSLLANMYHQIAIANYRLKERKEAIGYWLKADSVRQQFLRPNDLLHITTYTNIGNAYFLLQDDKQANYYFQKAIALLQGHSNPDKLRLAKLYASLADLEVARRNFKDAEHYFLRSHTLYDSIGLRKKWNHVNLLTRLFNMYKLKDEKLGALKWAEMTINQLKRIDPETVYYDFYMADAYNNLGIADEMNENYISAIKNFNNAASINEDYADRKVDLGINYNNLISIYNHMNQTRLAVEVANKATMIFKETERELFAIETQLELASIYEKNNMWEKASEIFTMSLDVLCLPSNANGIYEGNCAFYNDNQMAMQILYRQCLLMKRQYKLSAEIEELAMIDSVSDRLIALANESKYLFADIESQFDLHKKIKKYYDVKIFSLFHLWETTKEQTYLDRFILSVNNSKSIALSESRRLKAMGNQHVGLDSLIVLEQKLRTQKTALILRLKEQKNNNHPGTLSDSILLIINDLVTIKKKSKKIIAQSGFDDSIVGSAGYRSSNKSDVRFNYYCGESDVYLILNLEDQTDIYFLGDRDSLKTKISELYNCLQEFDCPVSSFIDYATQVQQFLIPSSIHIDQKSLLVMPDAEIGLVPFDVFLNETDTIADYKKLDYWVHDKVISYSFTSGLPSVEKNRKAKSPYLGIGCDYDSFPEAGYNLLSHSKDEISIGNALWDGEFLFNEDATTTKFWNELSNYLMCHVSVHGIHDEENSLFSYLQLYPDKGLSGKLYAADIINREIQSPFIYLSACNTGKGSVLEGQGIFSVAQAFSIAGVSSIVMNSWQIPQYSSTILVESFYNYLQAGETSSTSLTFAKRGYLNKVKAHELAHPVYWASTVSYGGEFSLDKTSLLPLYLIIFLIGLIILYKLFNRLSASE